MVETAQTIKKSVEEGKIDGIIDKACFFFLFWVVGQHFEYISGFVCGFAAILLVVKGRNNIITALFHR